MHGYTRIYAQPGDSEEKCDGPQTWRRWLGGCQGASNGNSKDALLVCGKPAACDKGFCLGKCPGDGSQVLMVRFLSWQVLSDGSRMLAVRFLSWQMPR